ncbi:hypothetical protein BDV95DRAFT_71197 [Massariosphaeria phaeospora]|uniref:Uncharacterized protein n=1 Tax=Massariosphaeria phaeospora TaxID=100035 RepID=A0A7C8M9B5_9PLEO|nr:hypothetical protein BDV95DRAFT_71197 [Massariosphaeria phaeospora]
MATPPLFRIPRELRDRVYHFALYNQRAEFFTANLSLRVRYLEDEGNLEPFDSRHNVNFRWLLTSRQVLSEGLEQFYAHATLDFYCIWENDWNPDLTLDGTTSIFDLRRVKNAELALQLGKAHHEKDDCIYDLVVPRGKERSRLNDEDFAELGKVLKSVGKCAFEHLKLRVWLFRTENRTKEYEDTGNRWRGDL